ncbi:MAG: SURF1 family protein [Ferrovibrionaceae bacterium]
MIQRLLGTRPRLWPTLFTIPSLIILFCLGSWQVNRLMWKRDVIATIEARVHQPPAPLPAWPFDPEEWRYRPASVTGEFLYGREAHLIAYSLHNRQGYQIILPFRRADNDQIILVNRGWVPEAQRDAGKRAAGQVAGKVTVTGLVMPPWPKPWLVPANEPARNLWFHPNLAELNRYLGVEAPPFFLEADATPNPGGLPVGGQTQLEIPNNHLQYAITWYSFVITLAVVYVFWHRNLAREEREGKAPKTKQKG